MIIRLGMKKYNMILTDKQQKHQQFSSGKTDKYEYFTGKEMLRSPRRQIIEQAKFICCPLGKALEKQIKKVGALNSLDLSNKKDELKQVEGIFPQNMLNDLFIKKLKEITKLHNINKNK